MKICSTVEELEAALNPFRINKRLIGFVPTMGALHHGHLSLITKAKQENDLVVCSIFVNPTQFNNAADLEKYPRTLGEDERMLKEVECDVLFVPSVDEIYLNGNYSVLNVDFGVLDKGMEGKSRPGHFAGMITVVNKLFMIVKPNSAYFGKKDFQQLALVKYFVQTQHIPVSIRECPIVREADGLAMSSRNRLLSPEERKHALLISKTLFRVKEMRGKKTVSEIKSYVESAFANDGLLKLDYFEIVNAETLVSMEKLEGNAATIVACIAAFAGNVRLIDNETI
jgi:pantoate--beta-alanine ligase